MRISVVVCSDFRDTGRSIDSIRGQTWQQVELLLAYDKMPFARGDYALLLPAGATLASSTALEILFREIRDADWPEIVLFPCQGPQGIVPPPANAREEAPSLAVRADVWNRYSNHNDFLAAAWKKKTQVLRLNRVLVCLSASSDPPRAGDRRRVIVVNDQAVVVPEPVESEAQDGALSDRDHPLLQATQDAAGQRCIPGDAD